LPGGALVAGRKPRSTRHRGKGLALNEGVRFRVNRILEADITGTAEFINDVVLFSCVAIFVTGIVIAAATLLS